MIIARTTDPSVPEGLARDQRLVPDRKLVRRRDQHRNNAPRVDPFQKSEVVRVHPRGGNKSSIQLRLQRRNATEENKIPLVLNRREANWIKNAALGKTLNIGEINVFLTL